MNKSALIKIVKELNKLDCNWGVGGSVLLNNYNLVDKPNDIDIIIDPKYADKIKKCMDRIGTKFELPSKEPFLTEEFFGYEVDGTIVEFMGGFKIRLDNGCIYEFILDEDATKDYMIIDDIKINLTTLEDWYVAYSVMKDPKRRLPLLKGYFDKEGVRYTNLLERNLKQDLLEHTKSDIKEIL